MEIQLGDMYIRVGDRDKCLGSYSAFYEFRAWVAKNIAHSEITEYRESGVPIKFWEPEAEERFPHLLIHCECGNYLPLEGVDPQPLIGSSHKLLQELEEINEHRSQMEPELQEVLDGLLEMTKRSIENHAPMEFC